MLRFIINCYFLNFELYKFKLFCPYYKYMVIRLTITVYGYTRDMSHWLSLATFQRILENTRMLKAYYRNDVALQTTVAPLYSWHFSSFAVIAGITSHKARSNDTARLWTPFVFDANFSRPIVQCDDFLPIFVTPHSH